ncbi:SLAM family member 5-like isoform X2 [Lissotriton helveticus]
MFLEIRKAVLWSWILLLGCGVQSSARGEQPPLVLNAAESAEVRFPVHIPDGFEIEEITWLFEGNSLAQLTLPNNLRVKEKRFKGRVSINGTNASLHIWKLTINDSGEYRVEIYEKRETKEREVRKYTLRIFNRVTAQVNISAGNETCNIILNCTEKDGNNVTYRWRKGKEETSIEPIVNFTFNDQDSNQEVCCQVKNPGSNSETCVIPWKETIQGFNRSNCESSSAFDASKLNGHKRNVVVGIVVCLLALLAVATVVCWYKRKKDPEAKNDVQTVYATVNKPKNATREENRYQCTEEPYEMERVHTVYAEVQNARKGEVSPATAINPSTSEEDKEMELYDKVQHPKIETNSDPTPSKQPNDPGGAENEVSLYDTVKDTLQNNRDEKKKLMNENPAPPYNQIIRGNNRPAAE